MSFDPDTLFYLECKYLGDSVTINLGGYHDAVEVDETTWIVYYQPELHQMVDLIFR